MYRDIKVNTPHLAGGSELLVMAPIKPGFVPGLDAVTYKTRAKILLATLHSGRQGLHEQRLLKGLSDAVERIGVIHTVRVLVVEGPTPEHDKILLSVNFDGSYEAYVRVIWQKSARLLDLIFCNTVDYVTGWDHSFDEWNAWLRSVQVETPFFYAKPGVSMPDLTYLRMLEDHDRRASKNRLARVRIVTPTPEEIAWQTVGNASDPTHGPGVLDPSTLQPLKQGISQGLQSLAGVYRLNDVYPPGTNDGLVLLRAARELLPELLYMLGPDHRADVRRLVEAAAHVRFQRQLSWFAPKPDSSDDPLPTVRQMPPLPSGDAMPVIPPDLVQGGIVRAYDGVTDGCLCLVTLDSPAAAARLLRAARPTTERSSIEAPLVKDEIAIEPDKPVFNLAFTLAGLRACGLSEAELDGFPIEFRQGMAARAGLLGDVRINHPRHWDLPQRNGLLSSEPIDTNAHDSVHPVDLDSVHVVLQWRLAHSRNRDRSLDEAKAMLLAAAHQLLDPLDGVQVLSTQWMRRTEAGTNVQDHFGFIDGQSQPVFHAGGQQSFHDNRAHLGEVLLGLDNAADHAVDLKLNQSADRRRLMAWGSFLVIRKLRQNRRALDAAVHSASPRIGRETVLAKMMGRWPASAGKGRAGQALIATPAGQQNNFNYLTDPDGRACPLGSHIRRANPREQVPNDGPPLLPGARPPRIMRRSLPYGPAVADDTMDADRGLMFMAYGASIGEQFEVIQRWLAEGNSARGHSSPGCPFLGVPEAGKSRVFRFEDQGQTVSVKLDGSDDLGVDPEPLIKLQWGLYLFTPSMTGLAYLLEQAERAAPDLPWTWQDGAQQIQRLREIERTASPEVAAQAWKAALEDPDAADHYNSASIWEAIRRCHGGVLRIPYGVLVASSALVKQVLLDADQRTSISGYQDRLRDTIGAIYLGMDAQSDGGYAEQSKVCNAAIMALDFNAGFKPARAAANEALDLIFQDTQFQDRMFGETRWEASLDVREVIDHVLARLCEDWFFGAQTTTDATGKQVVTLPQAITQHFQAGGFDWLWQPGAPALYPGHFAAPSRHTFQPLPSEAVAQKARLHGQALRKAMVQALSQAQHGIGGCISTPVIEACGVNVDLAARTLIGAMMGFLPTTDGSLRRIFQDWTRDGTLATLRAKTTPGTLSTWAAASALLQGPLRRAMQLRPVPEQIWRTATQAHALGHESIQAGDKLILGLVSATQQALASEHGTHMAPDQPDVSPIFGGDRQQAPHPTHACPGMRAAIGVMVGVLSAVLDRAEDLLPAPAPGVLAYSGLIPRAGHPAPPAPPQRPPPTVPAPTDSKGVLLGFGDSWLRNPMAAPDLSTDLATALGDLGYDTRAFRAPFAVPTRTLRDMAAMPAGLTTSLPNLVRALVLAHAPGSPELPRAILVDGGGNDVTPPPAQGATPPLEAIVLPCPTVPPTSKQVAGTLDEAQLQAFLNGITDHLTSVLRELTAAAAGQIPIIVHAYDYPRPTNVGGFRYMPGDLWACFSKRGYTEDQGAWVMKALIDRLNDTVRAVVDSFDVAQRVHYLNLRGKLTTTHGNTAASYKKNWANEMHPNVDGFRALAGIIDREIQRRQ